MKRLLLQVREFQAVIGKETRQQCLEQFGGKPDICIACVGGGSNAIGVLPYHSQVLTSPQASQNLAS